MSGINFGIGSNLGCGAAAAYPEPPRSPEIAQEVESIAIAQGHTKELLGQLVQKLSPAMRPPSPACDGAGKRQEKYSHYGQSLAQRVDLQSEINAALRDIIDRLET